MLTGAKLSDAEQGILITAKGNACFYCGSPTADPAIMWGGMTGEIFLHYECAVDFTIRIMRDIHQLQKRKGNP